MIHEPDIIRNPLQAERDAEHDTPATVENSACPAAAIEHIANVENLKTENIAASALPCEFDFRKKYDNTPLVVIAGRPNVGKSTLFNRFLRKRRAITDPTPGVTRDPIESQAIINGKPVRLMDTGGFKLTRSGNKTEDSIDTLVVEKTLQSLQAADKILLMLEASPATAEDEEFICFLRPFWDKLIVAINKTEGGRGEMEGYNYLRFGFKSVVCISAEHGDNITVLAEEITAGLDFSRVCESVENSAIRIALIGKPNTGKSTLANYLTQSDASIISEIAGTTRDVIEGSFMYKDRQFIIQDTAGIRRKTKVKEDIEYYSVVRAIKSLETADIVFHLLDAEEGLTEQDKKIIQQATKRGLGVIFVLNKWDLVKREKKFKEVENHIKIMFGKMEYAPIVPISAQKGSGIADLLNTALTVFTQLTTKIDTSALNIALKDWLQAVPPPHGKHNSFTLKYILQTSVRPVEFLIFANKPDAVSESYLRYLQNRIRKDIGFTAIPLLLKVKGSRVRWEDREKV
ncbi:MAG: ribosome biogenesis GTPase Der [Treponema sp.]